MLFVLKRNLVIIMIAQTEMKTELMNTFSYTTCDTTSESLLAAIVLSKDLYRQTNYAYWQNCQQPKIAHLPMY